MRISPLLATFTVLMLLGAGCSYSTVPQPTPSTPAPQETTKTLNENNKSMSVTLKVGDRVRVVLNSTYWQFGPPSSDVLKLVADPVYAPILQGHVPGSGAGTVTAEYTVTKAGTAQISASRTSCGEALRCTGDQGSYSVTIQATN